MTVPLPSVGWIFVHGDDPADTRPAGIGTLEVLRDDPASASSDAEGFATVTEVAVPVRGYLALAGEAEQQWGATVGAVVDAVCALPRSVTADHTDRLRATGIDPYLDGVYEVTAARVTPVHLRLLLRRRRDGQA